MYKTLKTKGRVRPTLSLSFLRPCEKAPEPRTTATLGTLPQRELQRMVREMVG